MGQKLTTEKVIFYTKKSQIEKLFQKKARLKNHFLASLKGNRGVCNISRLFNPIQVDGQIPGSWKVPPYPTTPAQQQSRIWTEERNIDNNYWLKLIERLCGSVLPVFFYAGSPTEKAWGLAFCWAIACWHPHAGPFTSGRFLFAGSFCFRSSRVLSHSEAIQHICNATAHFDIKGYQPDHYKLMIGWFTFYFEPMILKQIGKFKIKKYAHNAVQEFCHTAKQFNIYVMQPLTST